MVVFNKTALAYWMKNNVKKFANCKALAKAAAHEFDLYEENSRKIPRAVLELASDVSEHGPL